MSPTSFPTITPGEAWDSGPGQASTLMNQITTAINALEAASSPIPTNYLAPATASYESYPRQLATGVTSTPSPSTLYLFAIALPAGITISKIAVRSAGVALSGGSHWWFTLHDSSRVMLAKTADQLTAAWAANTTKELAITNSVGGSTFTTTYAGLYYIGCMVVASPVISFVCTWLDSGVSSVAPIVFGSSNTGQSSPPSFPFTANALTAIDKLPYGYVGP